MSLVLPVSPFWPHFIIDLFQLFVSFWWFWNWCRLPIVFWNFTPSNFLIRHPFVLSLDSAEFRSFRAPNMLITENKVVWCYPIGKNVSSYMYWKNASLRGFGIEIHSSYSFIGVQMKFNVLMSFFKILNLTDSR